MPWLPSFHPFTFVLESLSWQPSLCHRTLFLKKFLIFFFFGTFLCCWQVFKVLQRSRPGFVIEPSTLSAVCLNRGRWGGGHIDY